MSPDDVPERDAQPSTYVVNVDVAVRRPADDATDDDHEYLFIVRGENESHAPGALGFPGGKVEADPGASDALAAAGRREVREEVGVEIRAPSLVTSTTFESDGGNEVLNVILAADYAAGTAHPAAPEEVAAVEWRTPASVFDDDATPPWTREALEAVLDG